MEALLNDGLALVEEEPGTRAWFAIRTGPATYGIFDVFPDDPGRQAHLNGAVGMALMERGDDLISSPPEITQLDVLGAKLND